LTTRCISLDKKTALYGTTCIGISWHRYYDPSTGRYLTPDPIGLEGGINLYLYAGADPVNAIDPDGLSPCTRRAKFALFMDKWVCNSITQAAWMTARNKYEQNRAKNIRQVCLKKAENDYDARIKKCNECCEDCHE
jgi:RHS repeat-associated protein